MVEFDADKDVGGAGVDVTADGNGIDGGMEEWGKESEEVVLIKWLNEGAVMEESMIGGVASLWVWVIVRIF